MFTAPRPALPVTAALLLVGVWLESAPRATAQTPLGGEFQINTYTTGSQSQPAVARNAGGDFLVVWGKGTGRLVGQGYDSTGNPLGVEFAVSTANVQLLPAITADSNGDFLLVFRSEAYKVLGRRIDASGVLLGSELQLFGVASWLDAPDVAPAGEGNFVVVTEDLDNSPYVHALDIIGKVFDSSGNPISSGLYIHTAKLGMQFQPAVASARSGDFVVVWKGYSADIGIFGQRFNALGERLGGNFRIDSATGANRYSVGYPDVASSEDGNFVVVWESARGETGLFARRYEASGNPLGSELQVSTHTLSSGEFPVVAFSERGGFVISWSHLGEIHAREFSTDGTPRTPVFRVNTYTTSTQRQPSIAADERGSFVVVWNSYDQDGSGSGIFGQRFAGPGLTLTVDGSCPGPVTVDISSAPPNSEVALIAAANTNGFTKGGALCNGTQLAIGEPFQLPPAFVIVDGHGNGSANLNVAADRCHVQALALQSCETSNVAVVP